jgi:2'-hydroxyisoflavone reductase
MQSSITAQPARILVLGGTRFLGRAIVDAAVECGHEVTLFNRGITQPGLYPDLDQIMGDRTTDLSGLHGREFDIAIDVAAYHPDVVRMSLEALAGRVGRYVFVSTVSVYADQSTPQAETGEVLDHGENPSYGARKAACEELVLRAYRDHALVVRPGMIVGPHDPTDRFAYWPRRLSQAGPVLVPGDPADLTQFIDVRDLAAWTLTAASGGSSGVYNATGMPLPMGALVDACRRVTGFSGELVWVPTPTLLTAGVDPWMGVPMWIAAAGCEAINEIDTSKARSAGLHTRTLTDTLTDTFAWDLRRGGPHPGEEGLSAAQEHRLLDQTR